MDDALDEPDTAEDGENDDPEDADGHMSRLWVDRFSPRHYTELLSDDVSANSMAGCNRFQNIIHWCHLFLALCLQFTNRCLLKWLKLWDTVVFGKERKSRPVRFDRQAANQNSSKPGQPNQNPNRFKTKIEMTEELLEADLDQYKRPKFKVNAKQYKKWSLLENLFWSKLFNYLFFCLFVYLF